VTRHKFGVLGVHDLKAKMEEKGVPFTRECRIFAVCIRGGGGWRG
jgi:hypothetical protein